MAEKSVTVTIPPSDVSSIITMFYEMHGHKVKSTTPNSDGSYDIDVVNRRDRED